MRLFSELFDRRTATPAWRDWRMPATRDAYLLLGFAGLIFGVAHIYELPPHLLQFGLDNADTEIDDLIFVVFMLSVASMIYGLRRYRDLANEVRRRITAEVEARKLARHDPLTGLPNRRFFEEQLEQYLSDASAAGAPRQTAILMLDLDGFKTINDSYGHATGDRALCEFARRLSSIMRADAFFARVGGDEFTIIMPTITSVEDPAILARRIVTAIAEPFILDQVRAEFGVGLALP